MKFTQDLKVTEQYPDHYTVVLTVKGLEDKTLMIAETDELKAQIPTMADNPNLATRDAKMAGHVCKNGRQGKV
jgi:hypothetical protein